MIERPESSRAANRTGLIATAFAVALVAMLMLIIAANQDGLAPPSAIPRWLPLGLLYGAPAVIGWLGALSDRGRLLAAAGLLYVPLAVLAFSGVTLPFFVPALLYLRAAGRREYLRATGREPGAPPAHGPISFPSRYRRVLIVFAAGVASTPIVLWIVLNLGVIGVFGLVLLAGLAQVPAGRGQGTAGAPPPARSPDWTGTSARARLVGALEAVAIVTLVLAAGAAAIATTEQRCWIRTDTPNGPVFRQIPPTNMIALGPDESAGGCDSGEYTLGGIGLEASLLLGAIGVAALLARPGASRPSSS